MEWLAERGGLGPCEAVCVLEDRKYDYGMTLEQGHARLSALVREHEDRGECDRLREAYMVLDNNWATLHEAAMSAIREAVGEPGASVPEIVEAIAKLRSGT